MNEKKKAAPEVFKREAETHKARKRFSSRKGGARAYQSAKRLKDQKRGEKLMWEPTRRGLSPRKTPKGQRKTAGNRKSGNERAASRVQQREGLYPLSDQIAFRQERSCRGGNRQGALSRERWVIGTASEILLLKEALRIRTLRGGGEKRGT